MNPKEDKTTYEDRGYEKVGIYQFLSKIACNRLKLLQCKQIPPSRKIISVIYDLSRLYEMCKKRPDLITELNMIIYRLCVPTKPGPSERQRFVIIQRGIEMFDFTLESDGLTRRFYPEFGMSYDWEMTKFAEIAPESVAELHRQVDPRIFQTETEPQSEVTVGRKDR